MGKDDDIKNIHKTITCDIDNEYEQFLMMSRKKSLSYIIYDACVGLINKLNINFYTMNDFFIRIIFIVLGLVYIFTMFLPFGGEFIATIIKYMICVLGGMYFAIYIKNKENRIE
jgi:hypothetical protein